MKILMVLMGLEIGGAETHVVELSKELARRGHVISVVSNGGVYENELKKCGITCFRLPLHSRKFHNMLKSYIGLRKIIKNNDFDLVHAHARIPGFICGLLQKSLKFRFITTTHWVFKTGILLNLMTNWGERAIAVSDDIRKYLIDNYNYPSSHIKVTINGIDTDKFSPDAKPNGVDREFDMGENKTRIVYVSRMDTDRSAVAFNLLNITPKLYEKYPDLEVVIVGGGNDFSRLFREAEKTNEKIGQDVVITTGSRVDINNFIACGDIFIGVSRAALEAMAAERPVIIAGNEGYIGIFGEDKLDIAIKTNYCCRGCGFANNEILYKDVCTLLDMTKEQRMALGNYNRQLILKNYSAAKMASDCEDAYYELLSFNPSRPNDVMISGYYGYKNIGDDSLLDAIIQNLKKIKEDIDITVLSATPQTTAELYKVNCINRFNLIKIYRRLRQTKLLISGGGSLMQDVTSTKSIFYYAFIMRLAHKLGAKVMVYANGIGPVRLKRNRKLCRKTLKLADVITLREQSSKLELDKLGINNENIYVTADPAYSLVPSSDKEIEKIFKNEKLNKTKDYFILSVREWKKQSGEYTLKLAKVCDYVSEKYKLTPLLAPMQKNVDYSVCKKITELAKCKCEILHGSYNARQLLGIIKRCKFTIGMRLHILIYSLSIGTPAISLSYDPKVDAIMQSYNSAFQNDILKLDVDTLKKQVDSLMENREQISSEILLVSDFMRKNTNDDAQKAIAILNNNMI